jgi:valyl-tRNA synthetase
MGWDDNGLPTERRVQNFFHVRCDARAPYEPDLKLEPATGAKSKEPPRIVSRRNFIDLCLRVTREDEEAFKTLWRRIGLSVDWSQEYSTIDARCRSLAQLSFRDLFEKGHVYSVEAPTMWDVDFQTAVAQAECGGPPMHGAFHHRFGVGVNAGHRHPPPRPLAACVGVTAQPDDARYRHRLGKRAVTPLFRVPVPIFPSEQVDPEKGTGILMVCTFGDATDVQWWREQKLPLRQIVGRDGRLVEVTFGAPGWESVDPEAANGHYAALRGKAVNGARKAIVELLRGGALRGEQKPVQHSVKF